MDTAVSSWQCNHLSLEILYVHEVGSHQKGVSIEGRDGFSECGDNIHASSSWLELGVSDGSKRHPPKRLLINSLWSKITSKAVTGSRKNGSQKNGNIRMLLYNGS